MSKVPALKMIDLDAFWKSGGIVYFGILAFCDAFRRKKVTNN